MNTAVVPPQPVWQAGVAPIAVIMISLNEGHNMDAVCKNLAGWAQEVFLVDSYSQDETVEIALGYGINVVQRRFRGFGDQWNFALRELPIKAPWTMKLDPDERLSDSLKASLVEAMRMPEIAGISFIRRLFFMQRPLSIRQKLLRVWKTGACIFTDVTVNEHPQVNGRILFVKGELAHFDSPNLEHWLEKQNRYSTAEALIAFKKKALADEPRILGSNLQRRMWLKRHFNNIPFRYLLLFIYNYCWLGSWHSGWVGYAWARLRSDQMRVREYKRREMEITGREPVKRFYGPGLPDSRTQNFE